jgi:RimJ/RimL family protein N-acetyltransferase
MKLRLIEIREDGSPVRCPGFVPPAARDALEGTEMFYRAVGFAPPWIGYLADWDGDLVGSCAFKGAPQGGCVEIAYQTFPGWEGRNVATRMVLELLRVTRAQDPALDVIAQTLPVENASGSVLKRCGFHFEETVQHPEDGAVWQWRYPATQALPDARRLRARAVS